MGKLPLISGTVVLASILFNAGCTKLNNELPAPTSGSAQIHPAGWNDTTSGNFHGKVLKSQSYNLNACISCHAKSFGGGISNVSCYKCHTLFPHPPTWGDSSAVGFHGNFLLARQGQLSDCAPCHGTSFNGGTSSVSCFRCHTYPHVTGWTDTSSAGFHGKFLDTLQWQLSSCKPCHGTALDGGTSSVSCFRCHTSYPHMTGWADTSSVGFHGKVLKAAQWQLSNCKPCHGTSLDGGTSSVSCFQCHTSYPHMTGWTDTSSVSFHGKFLNARQWQLSNCVPCHGTALDGGTTGVSCFTCHKSYPHVAGWNDSTMAGFHGNFIRTSTWDMLQCRPCHGNSYTGGRVSVSCLTCHTKTNGPENCTTCHGGANAAPPVDLSRNSVRTAHGVGAHQIHLSGSSLASPLICSECHDVPSSVYQSGHIDASGRTKIHFNGPLAIFASAGGAFVPNPSYDSGTLKCANTFCHGNWRLPKSTSVYQWIYTDTMMTGANYSPLWTGTSSEAACGSCHGLPPAGHSSQPLSKCGSCHWDNVAWDEIDINGNIIDKTKHLNGMVNVFGAEYRLGFPPPFSTVKGRHE